jgi:hypothetical protein
MAACIAASVELGCIRATLGDGLKSACVFVSAIRVPGLLVSFERRQDGIRIEGKSKKAKGKRREDGQCASRLR